MPERLSPVCGAEVCQVKFPGLRVSGLPVLGPFGNYVAQVCPFGVEEIPASVKRLQDPPLIGRKQRDREIFALRESVSETNFDPTFYQKSGLYHSAVT